MGDFKIEDLDLYGILGIESTCDVSEVKKAYRKKALQCHPDKNPDDPNAAKEFHQLTKILEVLTDAAARKAYDKVLSAKKQAEIRNRELDSKRRKLKEALDERERGLHKSADQLFREEIERLRKEGSRQVQEEMEFVKNQLAEELRNPKPPTEAAARIKIRWKSGKDDPTNGGYNHEMLHKFLNKYGDIQAIVISQKKKGSAIVEFKTQRAAEMAVDFEKGQLENPLELQWIDKEPGHGVASCTIKPSDYESIVLTKLRQAEERKKLIAQMMAEDNDE